MDLQLEGKTALVTGASTGLGRGIATALAAEGVHLCVAARRQELLESLAQEIEDAGGVTPQVVAIDIMGEGAPQQLADAATGKLGKVEILVNSAGGSRTLPIDATEDRWEEAITLNFTRVRQLTHALLPGMIERQWGRIINITGKSEQDHLNAAHSAKAAVHAWAHGIAKEVGKHGITVNSIPPGRITSEQILRNYTAEQLSAYAEQNIPLGRLGEPEELACLATFLASPVARYISGAVIPVDGAARRYQF